MTIPAGEIAESRDILADIERQIVLQGQLIEICRATGRPTHPATRKLVALTQMADRKRDHIRVMTQNA